MYEKENTRADSDAAANKEKLHSRMS